MQFSLPITFTILAAVLLGVVVLFQLRIAKTVWLIAQVTPYEQQGVGAGSILVLGDSTGYGTGAQHTDESVSARLGADFSGHTITNNSVNGRTIERLLPVVQQLEGQYDLILLQIGANDILQKRNLATVTAELTELISLALAHTEYIVMISSGNVGGAAAFSGQEAAEYEALSREFKAAYASVANEYEEMTYIDLFEEPVVDPFVQNPKQYFAWDGLHPNSIGYEYWYTKIKPTVADILQER